MSRDQACCPSCGKQIEEVNVAQLKAEMSQTVVKFWTCPECKTILGPTGRCGNWWTLFEKNSQSPG